MSRAYRRSAAEPCEVAGERRGFGGGGLACARALHLSGHAVTVFERDPSRESRWQGGMLDLHAETGQAAMRAVGLFAEFLAHARPEGQELRGLDPFTAETRFLERPAEDTVSAPEIDRGRLRGILLDSLPPETVHWGRPAASVVPPPDGTARLHFADGASADFDLVIGADGAWSRVRPAVSAATPVHGGRTIVETFLDDVDTRHPDLAALIGPGTVIAKGAGLMLSAQRNGGGHVRVYAMLDAGPDWRTAAGIDLGDTAAVREHLLGRFTG